MMQESYQPNGWLGMFLGTRLWYGFFGATLASEVAFEAQVDALCREFERGASTVAATPPASSVSAIPLAPLGDSVRRTAPEPAVANLQPSDATSVASASPADASSVITWARNLGTRIEEINAKGLLDDASSGGGGGGGSGGGGGGGGSGGGGNRGGFKVRVKGSTGSSSRVGAPVVVTAARNFLADCVALAAMAESMSSDDALASQINRMFTRAIVKEPHL